MRFETVGELRNHIKDLPDDTPVLSLTSNTMEIGQEYVTGVSINVEKYVPEKISCYDAFDGMDYTTTVYRENKSGISCLVIN